ncbi:MAG: DUF1588 domain-containing protein [Myxococcota bacterium]
MNRTNLLHLLRLLRLVTVSLGTTACYSGISGYAPGFDNEASVGDADDQSDAQSPETPPIELECEDIGRQPMRRISSVQYEQILSDVLPASFVAAALEVSSFPRTNIEDGFSTYATANTVSTNESYAIEDTAQAIAQRFYELRAQSVPALLPCLPKAVGDAEIRACIEGFVDEFGARIFRRSLRPAERDIVLDLFESIRDSDSADLGLTAVLQYFLQAPALLYVTESSGEAEQVFVPLGADELAARLALLFTNSAPDAELMAAVSEGRLSTKEDVELQARRLVESPEAVRAFTQFHHEWLRGFALQNEDREHVLLDEASQAVLAGELKDFAAWLLTETDADFRTLMTTRSFSPRPELAPLYAAGADDAGAEPRTGLLSTAAAMSSLAHPNSTSLIERGAFIRNHVLCTPVPPLPPDIDVEGALEDYSDLPTARQRLEPLLSTPQCAGCHVALNPLGFPFEVYDWAGAFRATENGATIDTSAELELGSISGTFADAGELLEAIADTQQARRCYATHWFRYALGRPETPEDQCTLDLIDERFAASGGSVKELLIAIATSDAFRFRRTQESTE